MKLESRIVEAGPPLHCEDCGTNWVTLSEDVSGIVIGCPQCNSDHESALQSNRAGAEPKESTE